MKKFIKSILILLILILFIIKREIVINDIIYGLNLFQRVVFPSIFSLLIISDYIISTNLIIYISNFMGYSFSKLFKVSKYASYVFMMSIFSGTPSNAKYIDDLLKNKLINEKEAIKILSMCQLYNPILILTLTSYLKHNDAIFLIITNIILNIIIGLLNRNYEVYYDNNKPFIIKSFNLIKAISNAMNTLLLILGSIITFIIITSILPIKHPLINGIFELTNGLYYINKYPFLYKYKLLFSSILLSFGGLSIITQIKSIFKDANLDYSLYYKSRILHLILFIISTLVYFKTIG